MMILALTVFGCSDGGSDSPATNAAHPQNWIKQHGAEARKTSTLGADCMVCHGADLRGQGKIPSCYSASYDGQSCHAGGPGAPHPVDGSYRNPANHGPDAKRDLTACQSCHGESGGPGSNPRFNRGISSAGGQGCEGCHGAKLAHPSAWAGPNATFHYTAQNIQKSCTLCHGAGLNGAGGVGVSCLGCHANVSSFTLDCAFCHGYPPDGTTDVDVPKGVNHRQAASISSHNGCVMCHGMKQSDSGGSFAPVADYALFNKSTGTPGDHWNGKINMNGETAYNAANFGCDAAGCHGNDAAHRLSDSGLTVALGDYGAAGVAHPLDATWLLPSGTVATSHVLASIANSAPCISCHTLTGGGVDPSCAECHTAGDPNLVVGTCDSCHNAPPDGAAEAGGNARPNREGAHTEHDPLVAAKEDCDACHNGAGTDTLNHYDAAAPANVAFVGKYHAKTGAAAYNATSGSCSNVSCHGGQTTPAWLTGTLNVNTQCASCHQAGTAQYNSYTNPDDESHTFHINMTLQCTVCHNPATLATNHFNSLDTQAMEGPASATIGGGTTLIPAGSYLPASRSCDPACHGAETW
jgi:predicted CxxxxCH...CXXCH cytochrome family protein